MSINYVTGKEYLYPNMWEFSFFDTVPHTNDYTMRFLIKSITLPFIKFTQETQNTGLKYITGYESETPFSIEFLETQDLEVIKYFTEWQDKIFDKKNRVFKKGSHVKNGIFSIQKPILNEPILNAFNKISTYQTLESYNFKNIAFLGIDDIEFNYEDGEGKRITAQFSADSVDPSSASLDVGRALFGQIVG